MRVVGNNEEVASVSWKRVYIWGREVIVSLDFLELFMYLAVSVVSREISLIYCSGGWDIVRLVTGR